MGKVKKFKQFIGVSYWDTLANIGSWILKERNEISTIEFVSSREAHVYYYSK